MAEIGEPAEQPIYAPAPWTYPDPPRREEVPEVPQTVPERREEEVPA